ncbi:hypothetical protein BNNNBJKE_00012 [Aeromonas phage vB_AdhM_DL]|nr:hypothetical protein BNCALIDO_00066 [Aeromonas phage vB_AdhM_TS9]WBF79597.1 hypothetical protein BNNNBJKE_00012 [Aeromonas phage vB_AdhM_DL]
MTQRRIVKSPFTKEERQGVFVTIEESRERRNKLKYNPDKYRLFVNDEEITGYTSDEEIKLELDYEFNYDLERMKQAVESETVYLPKGIKEKGEIMEWLLNYEKEK